LTLHGGESKICRELQSLIFMSGNNHEAFLILPKQLRSTGNHDADGRLNRCVTPPSLRLPPAAAGALI
jgi:hypothetical protein